MVIKKVGKVKYRQHNPWGCGFFTLANLFGSDLFITEQKLEQSKRGLNLGDLNFSLSENGIKFTVSPLYHDSLGKDRLPMRVRNLRTTSTGDSKVVLLPLFMICKSSVEQKLNHHVLGLLNHKGHLFIIDSLKEDIIKVRFKDVHEVYPALWAVHTMYHIDSKEGDYTFFNCDQFTDLIPENELTNDRF